MKIDTEDYIDILNAFQKKICEQELTSEQQRAVGENYERIWRVEDNGKNGYNFFKKYFSEKYSGVIATNHFTRKLNDYEGNPKTPIRPAYLTWMLIYVGYSIPTDIPTRDINSENKKADLLYKIYTKEKLKKTAGANEISLPQPEEDVEVNRKNLTDKKTSFKNPTIEPHGITDLRDTIINYYQFLDRRSFHEALECWQVEEKYMRWGGSVRQFVETEITPGLLRLGECPIYEASVDELPQYHDMKVEILQINFARGNVANVIVRFKEYVDIYNNDDSLFLSEAKVSDLNKVVEIIRSLMAKAREVGYSDLDDDKFPVWRFFNRPITRGFFSYTDNLHLYKSNDVKPNLEAMFSKKKCFGLQRIQNIRLVTVSVSKVWQWKIFGIDDWIR